VGDLRDEILASVAGARITACIVADDAGIVAETGLAAEEAGRLGLSVERILTEGSQVEKGDEIARFHGNPRQIVVAEEVLMGIMAKPSGIATAARRFVKKAGQRPRIVCGAWKKMPSSQKAAIRRAVVCGGAWCRMSQDPFVYLDKNYVEIFGGVGEGLRAVANMTGHVKVVQLRGRHANIELEACEAVEHGAHVLHVDSGSPDDAERVSRKLKRSGTRNRVRIAFSGDVRFEHMDALKKLDIDILDIGRSIVDAPLLDMRMEVLRVENGEEVG
jgi:nicotinate-nucleotide pyrophosphorylase (carboxylating)